MAAGGGFPEGLPADCQDGFFVQPTVLTDVPLDSKAWVEEIFGPVLSVRTFKDEAEAVAVANDSVYGLASSVMSSDMQRCARVSSQLEAGMVWENCSQVIHMSTPFGGKKMSGFGWEMGEAGLEDYVSRKTRVSAQPGASWNWYNQVTKEQ